MGYKNEDLLDNFAGIALGALITKMPFYDKEGEFGKTVSEEDLQLIKKNLTATAYEYASWMLIAKKDGMSWLYENEERGVL